MTTQNITHGYFSTVTPSKLVVNFNNCKFYNSGEIKDVIGTKGLEEYCKFVGCEFSNLNPPAEVSVEQLNTLYYENKMKAEVGTVLADYHSYLDEKYALEKKELEESRAKQQAYIKALETTPDLTYEDFLKSYPMLLPIAQKPTIPQSVKDFMKKYL